jgi:hypothetical protein
VFNFAESGANMSQKDLAVVKGELATGDKEEDVIFVEETNKNKEEEKSETDVVRQPETKDAVAPPQCRPEINEAEASKAESGSDDVTKTTALLDSMPPTAQQKVAEHLLQNMATTSSQFQQKSKVRTLLSKTNNEHKKDYAPSLHHQGKMKLAESCKEHNR